MEARGPTTPVTGEGCGLCVGVCVLGGTLASGGRMLFMRVSLRNRAPQTGTPAMTTGAAGEPVLPRGHWGVGLEAPHVWLIRS